MTGLRRGAAVLALILGVPVASGCAGEFSGASSATSAVSVGSNAWAAAGTQPFVHRSRTEFVVSTPETTIGRYPGSYTDVGFTRDNSQVFALDGTGGLAAVPTTGGTTPLRIDCRCERIFPLHGAVVGWWQQPDSFVQADLHGPKPALHRTVTLPPLREPIAPGNALSDPRLLAADERMLIIARVEAPPGASWGINHLFLVELSTGTVRELGRVDGVNTALAAGTVRADGWEVILPGYRRDGIACGTARMVRIALPEGQLDVVGMPAVSTCSALEDLRWTGSVVTATGLAWEPGSPDRLTETAVWSGSGAQWDRHGDTETLRYAPLTSQATLRIQRTGTHRVRADHAGDLVLAVTTEVRVLAHDVADIRLPWPQP
ncbi:hypothetical protein [Nocardia transvalensis]|uniref:hypothetical protein n=1 Tax=Nocardia transvalensis TaxID=37333 RepID=UPI0018958FA0|nr:hypothetical protein [Nocardia transvalensis]MBF6327398.1 hypothetical protein [Nocardia transvalensis]